VSGGTLPLLPLLSMQFIILVPFALDRACYFMLLNLCGGEPGDSATDDGEESPVKGGWGRGDTGKDADEDV